jgi:hypothetical protein
MASRIEIPIEELVLQARQLLELAKVLATYVIPSPIVAR